MADNELGVIATIQQFLDEAGTNSFTREEILGVLVQVFPERKPESMLNTIKTQIPGRMSKERGYAFRQDGNRFIVIPPKQEKGE